ncbi:ABC transporter permease [Nocardioides guangzhouensis]|uniref:ABC transporter permease n=1 Tax=Nocardioides guangzhouensis TaxID=2497878 RepID=A0A4Q4ZEP0_9ACTN|nr:ABC transporter permease [Nocardioides guangzhouensis]RYP85861.1 ABC transporter permease [Nocardioides guangzhouensis]
MRALRAMTWVELKLFAREPVTVLFLLVLPLVILYVLNGVFGSQPDPTVWEGQPPVDFYTPSYVALTAATAGILSLPVHLAGYREQGVLRRFRASAIRPATLIGAHMVVAGALATAGALLLTVVSWIGYDVALPEDWLGVLLAYLVVILAFTALGGLLGLAMPTARAAQGLGVLLFFVFMMLGGAGPPKEALPTSLQHVADVVPVTHAGAMLRHPWLYSDWDVGATAVMLLILVGSVALTAWRLRHEEAR